MKIPGSPRQLLRDGLVLLGFAALVVAAVAVLEGKARRSISHRYILGATEHAATEFESLKADVESSLGMVRQWGTTQVMNLDDVQKCQELLSAFFEKNEVLSGISVADTKGQAFFLLPDGSITDPIKENLYNPVDRPWFAPALETSRCYWTDSYRFFTLKRLGVTASISWSSKDGNVQTVAAFDILLEDFFNRVQKMAPTPSSRAFVFLDDGRLYVPDLAAAQSEFKSVSLIKDELARRVVTVWDDDPYFDDYQQWDEGKQQDLKVVQTRFEGQSWWCGFMPLGKSAHKIWMGVLVPEADILRDMADVRLILFPLSAVFMVVMGTLYIVLVRRYRARSILQVEKISAEYVQGLIEGGENRFVEFKSTMRMNLHTEKPGKEIELAWLKGVAAFLNTDGGTLLLGVSDDGEIIGLERDVFENEDKCRLHFKNLVARHIGTEMSEYIRLVLVPMGGKTVGVVRCSRAGEPAFLSDGNKEGFYIRNGPSSDELPVSKAIKYISHRK